MDTIETKQPFASSEKAESLRPIRLSLADAFSSEGALALLQGDLEKGWDCFASAIQLDPQNSDLLFSQGLALAQFGKTADNEQALLLANKKFKGVVQLDPSHFETWKSWGHTLLLLGKKTKETHFFQDAKEKLSKAIAVCKQNDSLMQVQWDLGIVLSHLAAQSQEAIDWHYSIQAFSMAKSLEENLPANFWLDFGYAQLMLASKLNDIRSFVKAVQSFKKVIALDSQAFEGYRLLAQAMHKLYLYSHDEDHFKEACEYFSLASQIQPTSHVLFCEWAQFLLQKAEVTRDLKKLKACLEKCKEAFRLDPTYPQTLSTWATCLAYLGLFTERLDLIHEAQAKLCELPEEEQEKPHALYSEGICLRALARYFGDSDYDYQAIENFQAGLSIDRTEHVLWHALASSYAFLAQEEESEENFALALRFFQKALDLHFCTHYLFDYADTLSHLGELSRQEHFLEESIKQFENLFIRQRNALYLHPQWLIRYGCTLDLLGDFHEDATFYNRAIEIFTHVLTLDPDSSLAHHSLALALSHLGELTSDRTQFERALHHYRLATKYHEEEETVLIDWAITLMNLATQCHSSSDSDLLFRDAEQKIQNAIRLGNVDGYYTLACLYSMTRSLEQSLFYLEKAYLAKACPPVDEILDDEWLEELRSTSAFQAFLHHITPS